MTNALYDLGRQKFLEGNIAWLTDNIKVALVDPTVYTPNLATDEFLSAISSIVATSPQLTTPASIAGVAGADNIVFSSVSGNTCNYLVIYKDTGDATTSPLIACIDTAENLPVTPNGGDIDITWDTGSNKIFKL
jgi:hypothetical protein